MKARGFRAAWYEMRNGWASWLIMRAADVAVGKYSDDIDLAALRLFDSERQRLKLRITNGSGAVAEY